MKKKILTVSIILLIAGFVAFAGGVSAKSNLSTGWLRNPSRNTETKRPDASIYNIAGTAFADDGLYFEIGDQYVNKEYSHKITRVPAPTLSSLVGKEYSENEPIYLFPDFVALYKKGNWAASANFTIVAGGGTVDYKDGTALTALALAKVNPALMMAKHSVKVESVVYGETFTFAYKPAEWIAVSGGLRVLENSQSMKIKASIPGMGSIDGGYKANGIGVGGLFGIHVKPTRWMDFSAMYKTRVGMQMELKDVDSKVSALTSLSDFDSDIPAEIQVGLGFQVCNPVYVSCSFGYYFAEKAYQHSALANMRLDSSKVDNWKNSWNVQVGIDWQVCRRLCLSAGYNHGKEASDKNVNSLFAPVIECNNIMAGLEFKINRKLTFAAGGCYKIEQDMDYTSNGVDFKLNNKTFMCSIGLTYKAL